MSATNETTVCQIFLKRSYNLDNIRCFLANFSGFVFVNLQIGYVNIALTLLIIIISIFGKFKENYRWFVLNQAVWDLLAANEYLCTNLMIPYVYTNPPPPISSCYFHYFKGSWRYLGDFLNNCMFVNPLTALFLLSLSRVLVFYAENLYEKLTKNCRIVFTILTFNILVSLIHLEHLFFMLKAIRNSYLTEKCLSTNSTEYCTPTNDSLIMIYQTSINIFNFMAVLKDFLCLLFSSIFAALLAFRIIKTFILLKNRKTFLSSFRISFAVILQIFVTLFFFSSELITFIPIFLKHIGFKVLASDGLSLRELAKDPNYCKDCIKFQVPLWIESNGGLKGGYVIQATRQCRAFIDSIIVLTVITGYREAIVEWCKILFFAIKNPKKSFAKIKSKIFKNRVTVLH